MAYTFDANGDPPTTGAVATFRLKQLLVSAGWIVTKSSDGTTYNATGDQITTGASGAGGMGNSRAWFVIQQPGANAREFCFQKDTSSNATWRIKYSGGPGTGFVGGSPTATVVPSATDEQVTLGGGTDASPTFGSLYNTDATYRINILAGGLSEGYPFLMWTNTTGVSGCYSALALDVMLPGTYSTLDQDPAVVYIGSTASSTVLQSDVNNGTGNARTWFRKNMVGAGYAAVATLNYCYASNQNVIPATLGTNPFDGGDELYPCMWARSGALAAPAGFKGVSTLLRWQGCGRTYGSTLSIGSTPNLKNWVGVAGSTTNVAWFAVPWNGSDLLI